MKIIKNLILFLFLSNNFFCQEIDTTIITIQNDRLTKCDHELIGERSESPSFPGGYKPFLEYYNKNFNWDCIASNESITNNSKVYIEFRVEVDGSITNVLIKKGINKEIDKCYIEFIKNMPKWIPGKDINGNIESQRFIIPLNVYLK